MKNSRTAKSTLVAVAICLLVIVGTITIAFAITFLLGLQTAHVNKALEVKAYVDGVYWEPGVSVPWGTLNPGEVYVKNLTVYNGSNDFINVSVIVSGLPDTWTETWTANETKNLPRGESVYGNFSLTVPAGTPAGDYSWDTMLDVT